MRQPRSAEISHVWQKSETLSFNLDDPRQIRLPLTTWQVILLIPETCRGNELLIQSEVEKDSSAGFEPTHSHFLLIAESISWKKAHTRTLSAIVERICFLEERRRNLVTETSGRFAKNLQVILESSPAHRHYVQNHLQVILESSPAHRRYVQNHLQVILESSPAEFILCKIRRSGGVVHYY